MTIDLNIDKCIIPHNHKQQRCIRHVYTLQHSVRFFPTFHETPPPNPCTYCWTHLGHILKIQEFPWDVQQFFLLLVTYLKQEQIHLELSNPATDTASYSKAKRDGAEGVWPLTAVSEPSLWLKCERVGECVLIVADGIVTKGERRL